MKIRHTSILNVHVFELTYANAIKTMRSWIIKNKKSYVCVAPVYLVTECQKNNKLLKGVNAAGLVTPDGMPLVWVSKLYGKKLERVYGPTLMLKVCKQAQKEGWKIYLLGGAKGSAKELRKKLINKFPNLEIVGSKDTPIRPIPKRDNKKIIQEINDSNARIVFVGLGCPFQELWMIENRKSLKANVLIGVGAAFDFITGRVRQAPLWVQKIGFEWLFRLSQDPKRLLRRYTIDNSLFIYKATRQIIKDIMSKKLFFK
jgi:N-acetylglucosaminyldiphosphoundecaprenol N-acetyl-beta-D-mannosaminyltransferase